MRLDEGYVTKAMQDARRFQGCWDAGTSGTLAAHTYRLIEERRLLLATIDELERERAELKAEIERRRVEAGMPADVPAEFLERSQLMTFMPASEQAPAVFTPTLVNATMPEEQLRAAWSAVASKGKAARLRPEPIRTVEFSAPAGRTAMRLIGIAGRAGSGKTTAATMIPGAAVVQLADPLYAGLSAMLGIPEAMLRDRAFKAATLPGIGKSPRQLLQTLGTEWGRQAIREDIWLVMLERRIERLADEGVPVVAVADVRFENEADWVRARGGEVWHVYRDVPKIEGHSSERGLVLHASDRLIENTGSLDDLRAAIAAGFAAVQG